MDEQRRAAFGVAVNMVRFLRRDKVMEDFGYCSDARRKTRKRQRGNEEGPTAKHVKEGPFTDSLPTPWKTGYYIEGPLEIGWKERLVLEEEYKISFDTSLQSIKGIKYRMSSKGWDLMYATVSNSYCLIVKGCVKVPSEFRHSFPYILEDLKDILATETETDLHDDTDRAGRESVEVGLGTLGHPDDEHEGETSR